MRRIGKIDVIIIVGFSYSTCLIVGVAIHLRLYLVDGRPHIAIRLKYGVSLAEASAKIFGGIPTAAFLDQINDIQVTKEFLIYSRILHTCRWYEAPEVIKSSILCRLRHIFWAFYFQG